MKTNKKEGDVCTTQASTRPAARGAVGSNAAPEGSNPTAATVDEALDNAITALGQCQKGTARQFLRSAIDKATEGLRQQLDTKFLDGSKAALDSVYDEPDSPNDKLAKLILKLAQAEKLLDWLEKNTVVYRNVFHLPNVDREYPQSFREAIETAQSK